jgi:hypothetical protein
MIQERRINVFGVSSFTFCVRCRLSRKNPQVIEVVNAPAHQRAGHEMVKRQNAVQDQDDPEHSGPAGNPSIE